MTYPQANYIHTVSMRHNGEVLGNKIVMYISVTLNLGYLIVLRLFHLGISCTVFSVTCTVVVLTCFAMCVCVCVCVCVFVCLCVCVGFVMWLLW